MVVQFHDAGRYGKGEASESYRKVAMEGRAGMSSSIAGKRETKKESSFVQKEEEMMGEEEEEEEEKKPVVSISSQQNLKSKGSHETGSFRIEDFAVKRRSF